MGAAIVVAGGAGRRMGADKPALSVAGRTLLERVLDSLPVRAEIVVVGPTRPVGRGVRFTREDPPGGGPAAALATGVSALETAPGSVLVAVLAADLPGLAPATVSRLASALRTKGKGLSGTADGALLVDADGREQWLTGVWRLASLRRAVELRPSWDRASLRALLSGLSWIRVPAIGVEAVDLDTPEQLRAWTDDVKP